MIFRRAIHAIVNINKEGGKEVEKLLFNFRQKKLVKVDFLQSRFAHKSS